MIRGEGMRRARLAQRVAACASMHWVGAGSAYAAQADARSGTEGGLWPIVLMALVLAAVAALAAAGWVKRRLGGRLLAARQERQAVAGLLEGWQWRSDADHRVRHLLPPVGSPAPFPLRLNGQLLWQALQPEGPQAAALQPLLQAQARIDDLPVRISAEAHGERLYLLRATPLLDGEGRFDGFFGLLREAGDARATTAHATPAAGPLASRSPSPATEPADFDLLGSRPALLGATRDLLRARQGAGARPAGPALGPGPAPAPVGHPAVAAAAGPAADADPSATWAAAWLPALAQVLDDLPAAAFAGLGDSRRWQLSYANGPAQAMLELEGDPPPLDWHGLIARLPEPVRPLVQKMLDDGPRAGRKPREAQGWTVALRALDEGPQTPAVQWLTVTAPAVSTTDTTISDQEAFSYTVSHDLRAPIRVVEGFTRIVMEDYGRVLDRIGMDHLDRVLSAAARMNNMIDALLDLSRLSTQPLQRQPVNLSQLAGYVIDELRRSSPEREVEVHIAPDLKTTGDPTLLRMLLENLLTNAWKYSARTAQARLDVEVGGTAERPVYCVRDNGAGFDMRFADRLFGIFQRLHSASDFPGTGIGLASVRRIVRRHGGEIWAESEIGQGARFFFTLRG